MNNKKNVLLSVLGILLIMIITVVINVVSNISWKQYDIGAIQEQNLRYYSDNGLRIMDFIDMTSMFGIPLDETNEATFLSNINPLDEPTLDSMIVVVINTETPEYYYDIFRSYLDSYIINLEDSDVVQMYRDAVLKSGDNYVYFILGRESKIIESEITVHYN